MGRCFYGKDDFNEEVISKLLKRSALFSLGCPDIKKLSCGGCLSEISPIFLFFILCISNSS